jgi:transposase
VEVLYPRCAGLDVHKDMVVVCLRLTENGKARHEVRTFKTTTGSLIELAEWLTSDGCTHIVMEATGAMFYFPSSITLPQRASTGSLSGTRAIG